jgi:hypothetical protein
VLDANRNWRGEALDLCTAALAGDQRIYGRLRSRGRQRHAPDYAASGETDESRLV